MKRSLFVLGVAGVFSSSAFAATSNVDIYGVMNISIEDTNASNVDMQVTDRQSRIGFKGSEDLGGGLKAIWQIEQAISASPGGQDGVGGGALGNRPTFVGLSGGFGTVLLGRDYTPGFTAGGVTDLMGYGLWGNWLTYTVVGALSGNNHGIQTRASNGIHYVSPAIAGGLRIRAMYSTGERDVAPKSAGNVMALAATYAAGPLSAQAYYQQFKRAVGTDAVSDKQMGLGAGYNFGMFRLTASYAVADPSGDNNKHTGISIGAGVKVGVGEVLVQGIQQKVATGGTEPKSTTIGVAYVHPLSRRTNVYATYGQTRNNTTGNFALRGADETIAPNAVGNDPKAFSVGVRHTF